MRDDIELVQEELMSWSQVLHEQRFLMRIERVLPVLLLRAPEKQIRVLLSTRLQPCSGMSLQQRTSYSASV